MKTVFQCIKFDVLIKLENTFDHPSNKNFLLERHWLVQLGIEMFDRHVLFYCQYERGPSAATATACIGAGGLLGPGRKSAGRRGVDPVLQDLMHGRFAGSRGDGVEGELEQRAGEGPLSCDSNDAAPARDRPRAEPSERQRAHVQLALVPGALGRWQARDPSGHQFQQRIRRGGIAASAIARGRCRDAFAALLAEGRGPADCQLRAAARRSE